MKQGFIILFVIVCKVVVAQTNVFPENGNVGIGILSPGAKLHVTGNTGSPGDFNGYAGYKVGTIWPNGITPEAIFYRPHSGTFIGGQNTYRGGIGFGEGVGIYSVNPNPAGSHAYGDIRFHTSYWNGTTYVNADRMIIDINGNIGIGTVYPSHKLDVRGGINSLFSGKSQIIGLDDSPFSQGVGASLDLGGNYRSAGDRNVFTRIAAEKMNYTDGDNGYNLSFYVTSSGNTALGTRAMTMTGSGKIGIGTNSPSANLHVASTMGTPGDFKEYSGITTGNVWPKGTAPEIIVEHPHSGTSIGGQTTYRGGIGLGVGVGIYSVNPNPAGSHAYGDIRFHTSYWNGSTYVNADRMIIDINGNIGIGMASSSEKLSVNGNVRAKKVIVSQSGWPDYVFDSSYSLLSLSEIETFIVKNKRLPDMPSAKEVEEKGISVGDHQTLLLKKIEELTLYMIKQDKIVREQYIRILKLEKEIKKTEKK